MNKWNKNLKFIGEELLLQTSPRDQGWGKDPQVLSLLRVLFNNVQYFLSVSFIFFLIFRVYYISQHVICKQR